jgi:hypothetical protein
MCGRPVAFAFALERDFAERDRALAALLVGEVFLSDSLLPLDPEDVKTCVTLVGSDSNVAFLITTGRRGDKVEDSAKSVEGPGWEVAHPCQAHGRRSSALASEDGQFVDNG